MGSTPTPPSPAVVSQSAIDMLAQLFPHRKRSVLELILKRCDLDLVRAIESVTPAISSTLTKATTTATASTTIDATTAVKTMPIRSAFKPVTAELVSTSTKIACKFSYSNLIYVEIPSIISVRSQIGINCE